MEIIVTLAYFFLVRMVFFDYKLLRFNLFWKFVVFGIYAGAAMTEIIALGQYTPYSKELLVESRVLQIAPEFGGIVKEVQAKANVPLKKGDPLFLMDPAPRQAKVDEISKIVGFHKKKYQKEYHRIGVLCRPDDLILHELTFRLKEHNFIVLDSSEKLLNLNQKLDLIILTSDLYEIVLMEKFSPLAREAFSKRRLDHYCIYLLWKIRNLSCAWP